jgi:hypothetical protein
MIKVVHDYSMYLFSFFADLYNLFSLCDKTLAKYGQLCNVFLQTYGALYTDHAGVEAIF